MRWNVIEIFFIIMIIPRFHNHQRLFSSQYTCYFSIDRLKSNTENLHSCSTCKHGRRSRASKMLAATEVGTNMHIGIQMT